MKRIMKPNIIVVSSAQRFQGNEFQSLLLANGLAGKHYTTTIVCRKGCAFKTGYSKSARWIQYPETSGGYLHLLSILWKEVRKTPESVLLCIDYGALVAGAIVSRLTGTPLLTVKHCCAAVKKSFIRSFVFRSCATIITESNSVAACFSKSLPGLPITVIPDTTIFQWSEVNKDSLRKQLKIGPSDRIGLCVADFCSQEHRLDLLLTTADLLHSDFPDFRVLLVGELPFGHSMVPSSCIAAGHYDFPYDFYALADMYLCTSLDEGAATAVLDAVVRDIPVVAPDAGGMSELFGDHGWLVNEDDGETFYNQACRILSDPVGAVEKAREYGVRARSACRPEDVVGKYDRLISRISERLMKRNEGKHQGVSRVTRFGATY